VTSRTYEGLTLYQTIDPAKMFSKDSALYNKDSWLYTNYRRILRIQENSQDTGEFSGQLFLG